MRFGTAVSMVQSCGDSVSDVIAKIRWLHVSETIGMLFEAEPYLLRRGGVDATARNWSAKVDGGN